MQPDPGLPCVTSSGILRCVHQPVHVLYVKDGGQVSVMLSAVCLGLQPGQGSSDEMVLVRKAVGKTTQPCGVRTPLLKTYVSTVFLSQPA